MRNVLQIFVTVAIAALLFGGTSAIAQPDFTPYPNNPVLTYGPPGSWDAGLIYLPEVFSYNGQYYMFYTGTADLMTTPLSIGYATSTDGYTWTKYSGNPVFQSDGTGFDAWWVAESRIIRVDSLWIMYYNGRSAPGPGPGPAIGRATATDLAGPWTPLDTPVLEVGSPGEWDHSFVTPSCVLYTGNQYVMYYSGGIEYLSYEPRMMGMATSPDGINWTKYDDPTTTDPPYAESDPVLHVGPPGSYDAGVAYEGYVLPTAAGWELFYASHPGTLDGHQSLSYATSSDGINWVKDPDNPFLEPSQPWATLALAAPSAIKINGTYFLYYIGLSEPGEGQIGLATGTITGIVDQENGELVEDFRLEQNYPNPFNPSTTIAFSLPHASRITLQVFDITGRKIRTLMSGQLPAGTHQVEWDGRDDAGQLVGSGVYFYQLQTGEGFTQVKRMVLLK
ncbi:MAG: T9SS C-terminal target domain-containing protein [Calditrichaeota bacterium]|nr:MAG: T9SS C-terminal target domain-containing protein [Calditrichota bacterium]